MVANPYSQSAVGLASGRSSCFSSSVTNAGIRQKSSPAVVGIVRAFVALSGVRPIIVARFEAAHYSTGRGGYKSGYAAIDPAQMSPSHFQMLFVGLLRFAVQRLLRLDEHAQWVSGE